MGANPPLLDWIPGRIWPGPYRHSRLMWASTGSTLTSNRFWSFCLPQGARQVFRFRPAPGAPPVALSRLPFGWKYSPYLCQTSLARILRGVLPPEILLLHYLDNFLLVFTDREVLREAGRAAVRALIEAGFLISPKSVLDPVPVASFLGKELDLQTRQIRSHEQALLQLWAGGLRLAVGAGTDRHLQSFLGLLSLVQLSCALLLQTKYLNPRANHADTCKIADHATPTTKTSRRRTLD